MMVRYVTDTSGWKKWQCDYRLGLILIMPPDARFAVHVGSGTIESGLVLCYSVSQRKVVTPWQP